MGIYSDIQDEMKAAFVGELSDAVTSFVIFFRNPDDGEYTPADGEFTPDSNHFFPTTVADVAKLDGSCRGILTDEDVDDEKSNLNFNYKVQSMLVLDSELNSIVFDFDNKKYFITIGSVDHEVIRDKSDAANATRRLSIKEVQV